MYKINVAKEVISYFDNLYEYLKRNNMNVEYTNKIKNKFYDKIDKLKKFPNMCNENAQGLHVLVVEGKHIFLYHIDEEEKIIRIIRAYNTKQQIFIKRDY
ncbi:MAG: type II toxin-antitoxin system RelE/ParE family toxin [Bacilli bacterium]|nr:type II toxin-antitoxin system RelE/ParE family toxin [Bacilli bacterium]